MVKRKVKARKEKAKGKEREKVTRKEKEKATKGTERIKSTVTPTRTVGVAVEETVGPIMVGATIKNQENLVKKS